MTTFTLYDVEARFSGRQYWSKLDQAGPSIEVHAPGGDYVSAAADVSCDNAITACAAGPLKLQCPAPHLIVKVTAHFKSCGVAMPGRVQTLGLARISTGDAAAGETQGALLDSDGHTAGKVTCQLHIDEAGSSSGRLLGKRGRAKLKAKVRRRVSRALSAPARAAVWSPVVTATPGDVFAAAFGPFPAGPQPFG